ncbi:MAG: 50S ribosomal protein L4, partial [Candidatus Pacebacteria bacterium]|nr:50S ribosomal protein L4 [Candidatus Paceibacterota bacterium]
MKKTSTKIKEVVAVKSVKIDLPTEIFEIPMNTNLVHQVVTTQMANRRQVIAHAKSRAEVSGGGIKPWKQKGTGRARHGSINSPIWIGGGVTHGPLKDRIWKKRLPKNIKNKALFMILSDKAKTGLFVIAEELKVNEAKTKQGREFLKSIGIAESCLIALPKMDKNMI